MICLGIESSCDETSLALVRDGELIGHTLASQACVHSVFGGVVPELAGREHYRHIGPLFDELLEKADIEAWEIDCIAVARGPGLLGSLLVGVSFAKALALGLGRPLLGVNHLHAHLLAAGLDGKLVYPGLGLLVSGGHTQLYEIKSPDCFVPLGRTLDDAAGEAFDKVGNELGFHYPAGKKVDELAQMAGKAEYQLPRPYLDNDNLDFSFSGLKTAAITLARQEMPKKDWAPDAKAAFCRSLNEAIAETLLVKARRALERLPETRAIWLAGGVAANSAIRRTISELAEANSLRFIAPSARHCVDNGAMIAYAGYLLHGLGYGHGLDFEAVPRGRKIPEDMKKPRTGVLWGRTLS